MSEVVDIFIKTYHKDFVWLEYCLRSIKKFASGFRDVVIVTDDDGHLIPINFQEILPIKIHYVSLPSERPTMSEHGIGYSWQQYIKLSWYNYTDADSVLTIDSDRMFTASVTPETFKVDGNYVWHYRNWSNSGAGICHKSHTDQLLDINTEFDAMVSPVYILRKDTCIALRNCIISTHAKCDTSFKTIWDIIILLNMKTLSEFNIIGSFIYHFDRKEYSCLVNDVRMELYPVISSWSWGGLSESDEKRREEILSEKDEKRREEILSEKDEKRREEILQMWNFVDKVVYINLDHRQDRRDIMKKFFKEGQIPEDKVIRFPAIRRGKGYIGCLESHTRVVQMAKREGWKNVLILEDDLEWLDFEQGYKQLKELVNLPRWDVIQLVGWYVKYDFPRIYHTLNAGAYLVNGSYFDTLSQNRVESYKKITSFEMLYKSSSPYTADVYWNRLAAKDHWYGIYPCICHQVVSYSDNNKKTYRADQVHGIYRSEDEVNFFTPIQNAKQKDTT